MEFEELNRGIKTEYKGMDWILYPWRGKNPELFKSEDLRKPWGFFKTHYPTLDWKYEVVKRWDIHFGFPQSK